MRTPIPRSDKAIGLMLKGMKPSEAMRKAGYSEAYIGNCNQWVNSEYVQDKLKEFTGMVEAERLRALKDMAEKRGDATYRDLMETVCKFTKTINLVEGKPTEIDEIKVLGDEIRKIAEEDDEDEEKEDK